jgi:hypothetical protein
MVLEEKKLLLDSNFDNITAFTMIYVWFYNEANFIFDEFFLVFCILSIF